MTEGDWRTHLVEVNRRGKPPVKIVVAHLHPGEVATSFQQSWTNTLVSDLAGPQRLVGDQGRLGLISTQQGAGRLERGRNDAAAMFCDGHPEADALMFVDSDMGWDPDGIERLAQVMDDTGHPIIGGLCFGTKPVGVGAQQAMQNEWFPTLYRWVDDGAFDTAHVYPADELVEVGATGAAFLMIHRTALEALRAEHGDHWFDPVTVGDRTFGEDLSFCRRATDAGLKVHVHTGIRASHLKQRWYTESDYVDDRRPRSAAVTVVIPVKDRLDLTQAVVGKLNEQGGWTDLLIYDNGSTDPKMRAWLQAQSVADVYDASGCNGIGQMWNLGIDEAVRRHGGWADVILLNNDLDLGPKFCQRLIGGMRDTNAAAVSANYDRRPVAGTVPVRGTCGARYDGTGGLAGFAFALRAEWIATGYRFPDWHYFGDDDLCLSIEKAGSWCGLVGDAHCVHIDGGGQTAGTLVGPSYYDDQALFAQKWAEGRAA